MEPRNILKTLAHFAEREYKEKRPKSVKIYRVKSKSVLTRGVLPSLQIKQVGPIAFLVIADYGEHYRCYNFSRQGILISGDNVEPSPKFLKDLEKSTKLEFQLPKKEPITHPKDISAQIQDIFKRHINRLNSLIGINIIIPPFRLREIFITLITQYTTLNQEELEIIIVSEIFTHYLKNVINLPQILPKIVSHNLISMILTHIYFNFKYSLQIGHQFSLSEKLLKQQTDIPFDNAITLYNLSKEFVINRIASLSKNHLTLLIKSIHNILSFIPLYQIELSSSEIVNLHRELYKYLNCFLEKKEENKKYQISFSEIATLYYNISTTEFSKQIFGINAIIPINQDQQMSFTELLSLINSYLNDPKIKNIIGKLSEFISDSINQYISDKIIKIALESMIQDDMYTLILIITNKSEFMFKNFVSKVKWKPKKRLELVGGKNNEEQAELPKEYEYNLKFLIKSKGPCTIFSTFSFQNPIFPSQELKIKKKLGKLSI
ncbi:MAG: hypothetical protein EAX89_06040 [Candidatus Lokiarchaeota archaeon]|nr:hypothetical protein [Candidatus Lokiarchaeota archaeon]